MNAPYIQPRVLSRHHAQHQVAGGAAGGLQGFRAAVTPDQLSKDELIFMQRMLPHFMAGKTAVEAAEAVLEDDARLMNAALDRRHEQYVPTADERGRSHTTPAATGDVIFSEISRKVYLRLTEGGAA